MAGLFSGQYALRSQYVQLMINPPSVGSDPVFGPISKTLVGANSLATAVLATDVKQPSRLALFANNTSASIAVLMQAPNPDGSSQTDNTDLSARLLYVELPPNTPLNVDTSYGASLSIDPGTKIWMYVSAGTVLSNEKVRILLWG